MRTKNLISELEHENVATQKLLERIPADKLDWQPHEKAMTLGQLALHVATIPGRIAAFAHEGQTSAAILIEHPFAEGKSEILAKFKTSIATATEVLNATDTDWDNKTWDLVQNEKPIMTLPRPMVCRLLMLNHWYHHRGQLTTYLRILGAVIPSVYGPSADENPFA